jgi:L,D-peptidoglycan transpeptidase YkuD (ErfK/YbiS/YcfS/YnhG family)
MLKKIIILLSIVTLGLQADLSATKQLIVVTTQDWSTSEGKLQRFEKQSGKWVKVGQEIEILLGRNGLGWGRGFHTIPVDAKIIKKEGDGKAPAGIFSLKQAFGYFPLEVDYPYEVYSETDHCVDDVHSKLYNKIVDSHKVEIDYKSKEHMRFPKNYYKYGVVVNHNHIDEKNLLPLLKRSYDLGETSVVEYLLSKQRSKQLKEEIYNTKKAYYTLLFKLYTLSEKGTENE